MLKLSAAKREIKGEKARHEGVLPAVVYGGKDESLSLSLSNRDFVKIYDEAGESTLIDLTVDNHEAGKVLVQAVQYDPVSGRVTHVDLRRIDMNKPITARVELRLMGEAPVIKEQGGTLVHNLEEVEIECLPKDLVANFEIDLSVLKTFDDAIRVSDIKLPDGVKIIDPTPTSIIAKAQPALTEEQIKAMEEAATQPADLSKIEAAGKKKEAEEEAADGGAVDGEAGAAKTPPAGDKKEEKKEAKK